MRKTAFASPSKIAFGVKNHTIKFVGWIQTRQALQPVQKNHVHGFLDRQPFALWDRLAGLQDVHRLQIIQHSLNRFHAASVQQLGQTCLRATDDQCTIIVPDAQPGLSQLAGGIVAVAEELLGPDAQRFIVERLGES